MQTRWPDGLLLTASHERWRGKTQDARLKALQALDLAAQTPVSLVASAKAAGFKRIVMQYDATASSPDSLDQALDWDRLRTAGLTGVSLRFEGDHGLHDFIARQDSALPLPPIETVEERAEEVRRRGFDLHLRTRIARSNFRSLGSVLTRALAWRAKTWTLEYLPLEGTDLPSQGVGHAHPRLALSLPWVLRTGTQAATRGVNFALRGAPLCLLGPLAHHAVVEQSDGFAPVCGACPAQARCVGADATYLKRFGSGELRTRASPENPSLGWWSVAPLL